MRLFRKRKQATANPGTDALAARIAGKFLRRQRQAADFLNRKTQHWNRLSKLIALMLFVLLFGGASLSLIIYALLTH